MTRLALALLLALAGDPRPGPPARLSRAAWWATWRRRRAAGRDGRR